MGSRVRRNGDASFVLDSPLDRWMDIFIEFRRWDGKVGERVEAAGLVNCICLHIPASFREPEKERDCFVFALGIADQLGWQLFDDTDSGCRLGKDWLERIFPSKAETKPWWTFW